jgi:hypothetical protein
MFCRTELHKVSEGRKGSVVKRSTLLYFLKNQFIMEPLMYRINRIRYMIDMNK